MFFSFRFSLSFIHLLRLKLFMSMNCKKTTKSVSQKKKEERRKQKCIRSLQKKKFKKKI